MPKFKSGTNEGTSGCWVELFFSTVDLAELYLSS